MPLPLSKFRILCSLSVLVCFITKGVLSQDGEQMVVEPCTIGNLTLQALSPSRVRVAWDIISGSCAAEITYGINKANEFAPVHLDTTSTILKYLQPWSRYHISVISLQKVNGLYVSRNTLTGQVITFPEAPSVAIGVKSVLDTSVRIEVQYLDRELNKTRPGQTMVCFNCTGDHEDESTLGPSCTTDHPEITIAGLQDRTSYQCSFASCNPLPTAGTTCGKLFEINFTTVCLGECIKIKYVTRNSAVLQWNLAAMTEQSIEKGTVVCVNCSGNEDDKFQCTKNTTGHVLDGLSENTTYSCSVSVCKNLPESNLNCGIRYTLNFTTEMQYSVIGTYSVYSLKLLLIAALIVYITVSIKKVGPERKGGKQRKAPLLANLVIAAIFCYWVLFSLVHDAEVVDDVLLRGLIILSLILIPSAIVPGSLYLFLRAARKVHFKSLLKYSDVNNLRNMAEGTLHAGTEASHITKDLIEQLNTAVQMGASDCRSVLSKSSLENLRRLAEKTDHQDVSNKSHEELVTLLISSLTEFRSSPARESQSEEQGFRNNARSIIYIEIVLLGVMLLVLSMVYLFYLINRSLSGNLLDVLMGTLQLSGPILLLGLLLYSAFSIFKRSGLEVIPDRAINIMRKFNIISLTLVPFCRVYRKDVEKGINIRNVLAAEQISAINWFLFTTFVEAMLSSKVIIRLIEDEKLTQRHARTIGQETIKLGSIAVVIVGLIFYPGSEPHEGESYSLTIAKAELIFFTVIMAVLLKILTFQGEDSEGDTSQIPRTTATDTERNDDCIERNSLL